jgi:hypothetical protein
MSLGGIIGLVIGIGLIAAALIRYYKAQQKLKHLKAIGEVDFINNEYIPFILAVNDDSILEFNDVNVNYKRTRGESMRCKVSILLSSNGCYIDFKNNLNAEIIDGLFFSATSPNKRIAPIAEDYLLECSNKNDDLIWGFTASEFYKKVDSQMVFIAPSHQLRSALSAFFVIRKPQKS